MPGKCRLGPSVCARLPRASGTGTWGCCAGASGPTCCLPLLLSASVLLGGAVRADGDVRGVNVACPHIHLLQISCLCAGGTGITFVSLGLCKGSRSQNEWYQKAVLLLCFYRKTDRLSNPNGSTIKGVEGRADVMASSALDCAL